MSVWDFTVNGVRIRTCAVSTGNRRKDFKVATRIAAVTWAAITRGVDVQT